MKKTIPLVILVAVASLLGFWLPFLLKVNVFWGIDFGQLGMNAIVQNFDGLNFLVVAKSLYSPEIISEINKHFLTGNVPLYFSAHFPLMAVFIRLLGGVIGLPTALLITIILSNILLAYGLWVFFQNFAQNKKLVTVLVLLALFFPARMLSVRTVGSNEPLFIFFILMSITRASQNQSWRAALYGVMAVLTRSPGILLFGAYMLEILIQKTTWQSKIRQTLPYLMMPAGLIGLFAYYGHSYGDFFAYFHSGDNLHLFFPPFTIFSNMQSWISDMWREDIIYLYVFYLGGLLLIPNKYHLTRILGLIYGTTLLLIAHRDLARYALPISPLVWLGYEQILKMIPERYFKYAWVIVVPIYLLGWQFVLKNMQPINDWSVFVN